MNKWGQPKYMIAEGDTYIKYPNDETFPQLIVNYVKLDKVPAYNEDWSPLVKAMRAGDYFVSTGEVLVPKSRVSGPSFTAEVEWTFPLEFVEVVTDQGPNQSRPQTLPPNPARRSRFRSMPPPTGCASPRGIPPATGRSRSRST